MKKITGTTIFLPELSLESIMSILVNLETRTSTRNSKPDFSHAQNEITEFPITTTSLKMPTKAKYTLG